MEFAFRVFIRKCSQDQYPKGRKDHWQREKLDHMQGQHRLQLIYWPFRVVSVVAGGPGLYISTSTRQRSHHMGAALG